MSIKDYKFVIKVGSLYYNSGNYMLVPNPSDATRYMYNDNESILEDLKHACCEGGDGSIVNFDDAHLKFKAEYY